MSTFGLVHGGGFEAWCWDSVLLKLERRGHQAIAIDLLPEHMAAGAAQCAEIIHQAFIGLPDAGLPGPD